MGFRDWGLGVTGGEGSRGSGTGMVEVRDLWVVRELVVKVD